MFCPPAAHLPYKCYIVTYQDGINQRPWAKKTDHNLILHFHAMPLRITNCASGYCDLVKERDQEKYKIAVPFGI